MYGAEKTSPIEFTGDYKYAPISERAISYSDEQGFTLPILEEQILEPVRSAPTLKKEQVAV